MAKFIEYLKETRAEFKHVTWPTKMQTIYFTVTVIAVSVFIAYYLGLFDYVFKMGLERLLTR
jgi:preprotein translocase subunit SecE